MKPKLSNLSKKQVNQLPAKGSRYNKGLGNGLIVIVESIKKGGGKYFAGRMRNPLTKKQTEYSIGVFGEKPTQFDPEEAMEEWLKVKKWAYENMRDPNEFKRSHIQKHLERKTLVEVIGEFLELRREEVKQTTLKEYRDKLNMVMDLIGGETPVEELEWSNGNGKLIVESALGKIANGTKWDLENRCRYLLHRTFKYAEGKGYIKRGENPVETNRDNIKIADSTEHHPALEWEKVPQLLKDIELNRCNTHKQTVLATKLQFLTSLRSGALTRLEWDWIDFDNELITIAGTTSGLKRKKGKNDHIPHLVPITHEIKKILLQIKEFNFWGTSNSLSELAKYVFLPIKKSRFPHLDPSAPNNYLRNLGYKNIQRAHGLRTVAQTVGVDLLKVEADVVSRQLGHLPEGKVRQAYDRSTRIEERREYLEKWGSLLVENGLVV